MQEHLIKKKKNSLANPHFKNGGGKHFTAMWKSDEIPSFMDFSYCVLKSWDLKYCHLSLGKEQRNPLLFSKRKLNLCNKANLKRTLQKLKSLCWPWNLKRASHDDFFHKIKPNTRKRTGDSEADRLHTHTPSLIRLLGKRGAQRWGRCSTERKMTISFSRGDLKFWQRLGLFLKPRIKWLTSDKV